MLEFLALLGVEQPLSFSLQWAQPPKPGAMCLINLDTLHHVPLWLPPTSAPLIQRKSPQSPETFETESRELD